MSSTSEIKDIFSERYVRFTAFMIWERHIHWLASLGWERAYEKSVIQQDLNFNSGHEIVDLLHDFISHTGYVNAHMGLTSSDIIDNVRLKQVRDSMKVVLTAVHGVINKYSPILNTNIDAVGYTHWQVAAPVSWRHRWQAWTNPINWLLATMPVVAAKKFGGPVGDGRSLAKLVDKTKLEDNPFDWAWADLDYPINNSPLQSSDYVCEIAAINWVCGLAAYFHKMAYDLRFLLSHGAVTLKGGAKSGSSSMTHKRNPFKWEKACSILRSVSVTQGEIWAVCAHNGCERTLDGSWQLKTLLSRAFHDLCYALQTMTEVDFEVNFHHLGDMVVHDGASTLFSDIALTNAVLTGEKENRWDAYQRLLSQNKHIHPITPYDVGAL